MIPIINKYSTLRSYLTVSNTKGLTLKELCEEINAKELYVIFS